MIGSLIDQQALVSDEVFLARTEFVADDLWLEWDFISLPSAMRLIEALCD